MSSGTREGWAGVRMADVADVADGESTKGNLPRGEPITTRDPKPNFERSNHLCSAALFPFSPSTRAGGARAAKGNFSPLTSNQIVPFASALGLLPLLYCLSVRAGDWSFLFPLYVLLSRASGFVFVVVEDASTHIPLRILSAHPRQPDCSLRHSRCRRHSLAVSACRRTRTRRRAWAACCY